ncbi:hypothetical protein COHA_007934 [Chlorella ohadii]|uniref:[RNA-polymerase]-subunit kinase n=1 Tax=Chlorella ohadii TaxID=2649997 RepID=A0AAD5H2Y5_9CHLO|nr:hypothetical protein COHA_007934 [Chlorella ohadii]
MERYTKGIVLGVGTFGKVLMATDKETGQVVAIKKIQVGEKGEGVNVTALREVKLLRELRSPYLVRLLDVLPQKRGINLVMEYCESDLEHVIRDRSRLLSAGDIKAYMQASTRMILRALQFCHSRWVVHRDIKPNNFLVTASGELKLADFGLARTFGSPDRRYTNQVFARWYRPPELFYGSTCYGPGVDIWAAGCIFAELLRRNPWFSGESDLEVLGKIYNALGTPQDEGWGGLRAMPGFVEFQATPAPGLRKLFPASMIGASDDALDLLGRMMAFDASRRRQSAAAAGGAATDGTGAKTGGAAAASAGQQGQQQQQVAGGQQGSDASPPASGAAGLADSQQAEEQQQQHGARAGTPLFGGLPLSEVPESMLGRVERPKLDSSDMQYFKKRKFNLDDSGA